MAVIPPHPDCPRSDETLDWSSLPVESRRLKLRSFRQAQAFLFDAVQSLQAYKGHVFVVEEALVKAKTALKWLEKGLE